MEVSLTATTGLQGRMLMLGLGQILIENIIELFSTSDNSLSTL